jgi:serine/threonine protein kinase/WD40 repeat protein
MTPEQWEKVTEIYHAATELKPGELDSFLNAACEGDGDLRREVESLLAAGDAAENFISGPVVGDLAPEILESEVITEGQMLGHYRIVAKIGAGGMGEVFHAVDTKLDRDVALKTLSSLYDKDPKFLRRFRNEARAAATMNHPNVATVYSVEEIDNLPFITMELVDGQTLEHLTPDEGLPLAKFLEWFEPIADALCLAHQRGVIHRDVKPGNIMISETGLPKILDFGLAQIERPESHSVSKTDVTAPGQIIGTPSYMSPEQADGGSMDARSDIFSFGIVMYEALTGRRPFSGPSQGAIVQSVLYDDPQPVSKLRPNIPPTIARMVMRCLEKSPQKRFRSMKQVHGILRDSKSAADAGISMDSFARRFYREATTPSRLWWAGAAVFVVMIAFGGWMLFSNPPGKPPINFENMAMRRLSETNNVGYAQISSDGRSVAYATFEMDGNRTLWIRRVEDRNALMLTTPERKQFWGGLALSPDGGQAFYITADRTATFGTLYRVSTIGGPSRKIVDVANDVGGVSPDGERILFVRYGEPSRVLSAKTSDGSDEQVIVSGISQGLTGSNFRDPQYSHDGRAVYFIRNQTTEGVEEWSVEEIRLDSGAMRVLYRQPERISELAVLPGSVGLLMTAVDPVSNLQQIFQLSLSDGSKSRVTNDLFFYFGVSVDKEGKFVVASQRADEQRVWISDSADRSAMQPLNAESSVARTVEWTPEGRIVYDAYENNVSHIWRSDADGKNLEKLTEANADDLDPRISGDGRYIVFSSKRTGRVQLWRMDADGGNQTLLTDVNGVTQYPEFAADGQTVMFEWLYETKRIFASIPVTGGQITEIMDLREIPRNNTFYWAASPDGRYVAQSIWEPSSKQMKIRIDPQFPGAESKILNIWPSLIMKWSPDSRSIYYRERQFGYIPETEVLSLDISTLKSTPLISAAPEFIVDMSYSRDGKRVALVRGRSTSNAVMMIPATQK